MQNRKILEAILEKKFLTNGQADRGYFKAPHFMAPILKVDI